MLEFVCTSDWCFACMWTSALMIWKDWNTDTWGQFPVDENDGLFHGLRTQFNPLRMDYSSCFGGRKYTENHFLVRRRASPGEELQTKHSAHSAAPLHPADKRRMLDKRSQKKTSLFPPNYRKAMRSVGGGKTSKYYTQEHLAKCIEQPLAEKDGLILRVTWANSNNCSGWLSLSALEVWVKFFNGP